MKKLFVVAGLGVCAAWIGLKALRDVDAPAAAGTERASPSTQAAGPLERALIGLERPQAERWEAACRSALTALTAPIATASSWTDEQDTACAHALGSLDATSGAALEEDIRAQADGELALALVLEDAARGSASSSARLAQLYAARAGDVDQGYAALDHDTLALAIAAADHAARGGAPDALALRERLRAIEFPFFGTREEPLWRALYFREFDAIDDTIANRRHVAGAANAIAALCAQWEPPGIRSVGFDTGLESFLAPVRAQVPGRLVKMLPKAATTITESVSNASDGASNRSAAGWLNEAIRGYQAVKRDVLNSVAIGSSIGRDAAQVLFNEATSCRKPRGLKFIRSLILYFEHAKASVPRDAATTRAPVQPSENRP